MSPIPKKARRPRNADSQAVADARKWKAEGMSVKKIAGYLEVSRATVYRYLQAEVAWSAEARAQWLTGCIGK